MDLTLYNPYRRLSPSRRLSSSFFGDDLFGWPETSDFTYHQHTVDHWHPAVDISETEDTLRIRAEIPGLEREDIKIEVKDHTLTLSGERPLEGSGNNENYRNVERSYGRFFRSINLVENLKEEEIKATYRNGLLDITIPKSEASVPKQIPVEVH